MIITIDGPAGAGKSTIARALSRKLGISYLDTGAMYRALTLKGLREKIDLSDEDALAALARQTTIAFVKSADGSLRVTLDGEDVAEAIRSLEVTNNTFYAARAPKVREIQVAWQQAIGKTMDLVGDGRDLGTVVFPQAPFKFYLDADVEERARRRWNELKAAGKDVDLNTLTTEIAQRDHKDMTRSVGPLKKAPGAVVIDSTRLTPGEVVEIMLKTIQP